MASTEFEIEGRRFQVGRLDPDSACLSIELVAKALGPAISTVFSIDADVLETIGTEGAGGDKALGPVLTSVLGALLANASQISALLKLFLPVAKFDRAGNGSWVELKPFVGEVFGGRVDVMVAFLIAAIRAEHACFLGGGLTGLIAMLRPLLAGSPSPKVPTG